MRASFRLFFAASLVLTGLASLPLRADSLKPVHFTVSEGTHLAFTRSPDGRSIAFDLQGTLFVLPATGGDARAITDSLGDDRQPSWSPDGKRIAFQSYRDGNYHIWTVRPDGKELVQVTTGAYDDREPVWSPDGKRLAFSSDRDGRYDVWVLDIAAGSLNALTRDAGNNYQPAWSPDGNQLAFVSTRPEGAGVYVRAADGTVRRILPKEGAVAETAWTATGNFNAPSWSRDGKRLSVQTVSAAGTTLTVVDLATGQAEAVSAKGEDVFPFRAEWIDNDHLLYTADGKLKSLALATKQVASIEFRAPLTVAKASYKHKTYDFTSTAAKPVKGLRTPVVSPDGKQIVFGALGDLWLLTIGQPKPEQLTNDVFYDAEPAWSPDGKQIVFTSDRTGHPDLYLLELASRRVTPFAHSAEVKYYPAWLPDGKRIGYLSSVDAAGLLNVGTLQITEIVTGKTQTFQRAVFQPSQPSWSPSGRYVTLATLEAYSSRFREGVTKFGLVDTTVPVADKLALQTPTTTQSPAPRVRNGPTWSPDGRSIAYVQDNLLQIVAVDEAGHFTGAPKAVNKEYTESPSWTADSKTIVYLADDGLRSIEVATGRTKNIPLELTWHNAPAKETLVVAAGRFFDGRSEKIQTDVDVIVQGNRITAITPRGAARPAGAKVIDATQQTVIPGLIDRHTHPEGRDGESIGRLWLAYGITSIRQPGGDPRVALDHRESWLSGKRPGPLHFFTGPLVDGNRVYYKFATAINSEDSLARELNHAVALDYDFIKTYVRFPDLWQKKVTEFAHAHGIGVSSHEIYPAASYGVDGVEHLSATSRRGYTTKSTALNRSYDDVIQIISRSGIVFTPTYSLHGGFNSVGSRDPSILDTPQFTHFFPASYRDSVRNNLANPAPRARQGLEYYADSGRVVKRLFDAGAIITPGTDSPLIPYGITLHVEIWNYVEAGFTPFQALQSATIVAARTLHVDGQIGTLEVGKLANLIAVDGNPLENIRDTQRVRHVLVNGHAYTLEQLLQDPVAR